MKSAGRNGRVGIWRRFSSLALPASLVALAGACSDAPEALPLPAPPVEEQSALFIEEVPISVEELGVPDAPSPESKPPRSARASRKTPVASQAAETPAPPAGVHVPLEALLRTPLASGPPKVPLDLREKPVAAGPHTAPGALDRWKDRVRVEQHSEPIGPSGPRQGTVSQTDAGLRIPVDESVSLEGGVRVDQRAEPDLERPQRTSMPRVGVEVKF